MPGHQLRRGKVEKLTLVVEAVNAIDTCALVVAAQDEEVLRVLDLVGQKKANSFQRLLSTINVVTKEKVVGLGRESAVLEETQKIVVLAMDITCR